MRILIDYRPALRERTGVGEYVHLLARALALQRVDRSGERRAGDRRASVNADDVEVFSSSWRDRPRPDAVADLGSRVTVNDCHIPVRLLNAAWHRLGWPPVEWLTGRRYDVVHSPHPLLMPSRRAARLITIHDLDFLLHPEHTTAEVLRDYGSLVRKHAARADGVIVSSQYAADLVSTTLGVDPDRIALCPAGVPEWRTDRPVVPGNTAGRYVLFVGTLEARKNVGRLLDAWRLILDSRPDVPPLVLAGRSTPAAGPWLAAIARAPLTGRVEYRGYVPSTERQALYEGARLLVLPSLDEGFGLPVLEAMSLGVPVVASNRGALPEVSGGAARLVDPEDPAAIAQAVLHVLDNGAEAARMAERGLTRARDFTWAQAAQRVRAAYERAIDARRRRRAPQDARE